MFPAEKTIRHIAEAHWIRQALGGDPQSANRVFEHLSSTDPAHRQIMVDTFHDLADLHLCHHLLQCLAVHRLDERRDCDLRSDPEASERIDQTLIEFFKVDEDNLEKTSKEAVLNEALNDTEPQVRHATAFLLGIRGNAVGIPVLEDSIKNGKTVWKIRAIQALGALRDPRGSAPLITALSLDRDVIHREALKALKELGALNEPAWQGALNHPDWHIRWHAARGLSELGDPRGMEILAKGLVDAVPEIQWASAEGLAHLGPQAIPPILTVLSQHKLVGSTRQAAYSALQRLAANENQARLKPLLEALSTPASSTEVPELARRLLAEGSQPV